MSNVTRIEKISTTTFLIHRDDGTRTYVCRGPHNPIYTETPDGNLHEMDFSRMSDSVSVKAGLLKIRDRIGPNTIGHRQDGSKQKYLGLRPSTIQDGSIQLEFSINEIKLSGVSLDPELANHKTHDIITHDFGDVMVRSTRQGVRQMVKADDSINDFLVSYELHLTGLTWEYRADLDEYWFYDLKGKFRYRIVQPKILDTALEPVFTEDGKSLVKHSMKEVDGRLIYNKTSTTEYLSNRPTGSFYIDLDIVFSSTADGAVFSSTEGSWETARNSLAGAFATSSGTSHAGAITVRDTFLISRSFFYFDTSAIAGTVTAVDLMIVGFSKSDSEVSAQEGTQGASLNNFDLDSFTDWPDGTLFGSSGAWQLESYNTFSYNAAGIASINQSGETLVCCREKDHDFDNVPPTAYLRNGCYFSDEADTDKDPKMEITVGEVPVEGVVIPLVNAGLVNRGLVNGGLIN